MKQLLPLLLLALQCLSYTGVDAQNSKLKFEKQPEWVTVNNIDYNNKKLEGEAEDGYLDIGYEKQVSLLQQARYYKKTIKILSEAGVQNSSEISVNFDPVYEQLIFHGIRIIRDGKSLNKLRLSDFKIIQQEKELSMHMYDGSLTALLVLDDVRKGDIIESSYTIKGFNPIFNGKYDDEYTCCFSVPMCNLFYKLIVPANRNITIKNHQTNLTPTITRAHNQTTYEWRALDVAPLHLESKTPEWFDPYASIMVSEFRNWNEVSNWAAALFPGNLQLSPELQKRIKNIKETYPDNEARTLAALRFTQDEVRYMAIEIGINSHKPSPPDKIFAQRFGDCKDKSYLLVTMLNEMGIEANPVLINAIYKKTLRNWLPSASAFDHCTVQVKVNGNVYWFDPTISFQRGAINDIAYPDYQTGLVINKSTTDLTAIPFHEPGLSDIKEAFDIPDMSGRARLKVTTKNTGSFADDARSYYNNNSLYEIKNKYKDYYASYFDKITVDSLTYENDDMTGAFTTIEYYTINDIWQKEEGKKKLPLSSYVINGVMSKPSDKKRTMPFYLTYPARYKEQVKINLPEDWPMKAFNERVSCAGFKFIANGESTGNNVTLYYEYENLKDNVMPEEAASFFSNYEKAYKDTDYEFYCCAGEASSYSSSSSNFLSTIGIFPKLYTLLGLAVLITYLVRRGKNNAR